MGNASNAYRDGITQAWQGELWGKAFFERLAAATDGADRRAKWHVLADLEEAIGNRLAPLVADASDPPSADAYRPLDAAVATYAALSWPEAMKRMRTILDPAIERFQELLAEAPVAERDAIQLLVDHEVALKRFAERELAGDSNTSLEPVRAVIARAATPHAPQGVAMTPMTQHDKETFLAEVRVGILSIAREGRGPLTAPIWYGYAPGGDLRVMIGRNSRKAELLALGTRVSLCAQRESAPYAYVTVEGPVVRIEAGTDQDIRELATRYLGPDEGKTYADTMTPGSGLTVTVRPETWLGVDYSRA